MMTITVLVLASVLALAMVVTLRNDVRYALSAGSPVDLGDLRVVSASTLAANANRPVRGEALLGAAGGIRYERALAADTFRALPVAGRGERNDVWVDLRVPSGQDSGRWEPPRSFTGRLVRFDEAGLRHRGLADAIERATHEPVASGAFLLIDGEERPHAWWAVVLAVVFLGFAGFNAASVLRLVRKVRE